MSNGRTHSIASIALAAITTPAAVYFVGTNGIMFGAGVLSNLLLSPDLDIIDSAGNYSMHVIRKIIGKGCLGSVAANLWRIYWWPYARIVPHRSFISHMPVIGTTIRVLYITAPILLTVYYVFPSLLPLPVKPAMLWFFGLAVADTLHWIMDYL